MSEDALDRNEILSATQAIVAAHLGNNQVPTSEVPGLISAVMKTLAHTATEEVAQEPRKPAIAIAKSVSPERITCLECGAQYKSLKRHLRTHHDISPEEYRARWGLSPTYPMVAPTYAKARSQLAKVSGLGVRKSEKLAKAAE